MIQLGVNIVECKILVLKKSWCVYLFAIPVQ
jgi:hypothetical protein